MTVPAEPRASGVVLGIVVSLALFVDCLGDERKTPDEATARLADNATGTGAAMSLADIAGIANGFERNAALYELVADADRGLVEELLAEASALPATHHRDDVARVLYIRFAAFDPSAATTHALSALAKPYVLTAVFRAWAHEDLDAAVERAASLPVGAQPDAARAILQLDLAAADRETIAARLGTRLAVAEVEEAVEETDVPRLAEPYDQALARIAAISDVPRRRRETIDVVSAWAATDPAGAMQAVVDSNVDPGLKDHALSLIMHRWASDDPHAAIDWVLSRDPVKVSDLAFIAFNRLAETDLGAAQALVASLPAGLSKRQLRLSVFVAIVNQGDLDRSLTAFAALDPSDQVWVVGDLGQQMGRAAPRRAFEWLLGLDKQVRKETLRETLTLIYAREPELVRGLIRDVADPAFRIEAARYVVGESPDAVATLRWVESLGSEEEYAPVLADLFLRWMDRSARDATAALLKYPRGPGRDHALRRLVHEHLSVFDTGTAERFFEAIDSPAERRLAAERLHRYYMEVDANERKAAEFARLAAGD